MIHYDVFEERPDNPVLVLILGFSMTMHDWLDLGYVEHLKKHYINELYKGSELQFLCKSSRISKYD